MKTQIEKIFDAYKEADLTDRLNLFLQFPELRSDFIQIDAGEINADVFEGNEHPRKAFKPAGGILNRIFSSIV